MHSYDDSYDYHETYSMKPLFKSPISPSDMSSAEQDYRPIKRIRQACQNCRRKKARCTGERPECAFCVRLGQHCSYSDDDSPPDSTAAASFNGGSNKKAAHSVRFSDDGGDKDALCARIASLENTVTDMAQMVKSLESVVQNSMGQLTRSLSVGPVAGGGMHTGPGGKLENGDHHNLGFASAAGGGFASSSSLPFTRLPPIEKIRAAADLYFRYCHNQPYSLFHEQGLRNKIECGEVPVHLLFALLASTVRYSNDPFFNDDKNDKSSAVSTYANQSWRAIVMPWNGIQSDAELSTVQTILLLAIIDYTDGRTQASWIKVGLAIRLAQDFRLMIEPHKSLSAIQQEERRRVFWSFYLCDKLISCGRERPAAILDDHCKLQLPMDENGWRGGQLLNPPTLEEVSEASTGAGLTGLSPFAITIVVASLLGRSAQYALGEQEEQTPGGRLMPWDSRSKYTSISSMMLQYESELGNEPLSEKIAAQCIASDGTVDQHRAAPLALSHALFYLSQCLLYHPFLLTRRLARVAQRTPHSFLASTQHSCRSAASSLSRLMEDVKSLNCPTVTTNYDPFYGYCTVVAGVIHAVFTQSSDKVIRDEAKANLDSCMETLQELSLYWKSCAMMRSRLEDFRANCDKYAILIQPPSSLAAAAHETTGQLLPTGDANDLLECLDYARMSTTPRRKSQGGIHGNGQGMSGTGSNPTSSHGDIPALSQLPSPFFEELVNLLPLSYSRPVSVGPLDNMFATPGAGTMPSHAAAAAAAAAATPFDGSMVTDATGGLY